MNWVFVGAGNMASSLIGGLIASDASASDIWVIDPDAAACQRAQQRFGIQSGSSLEECLPALLEAPTGIVIAVKPPIVEPVCKAITVACQAGAASSLPPLVISVAAGVKASSMEAWLPGSCALVRCMPNTPALLGLGATALYANAHCAEDQRSAAQNLLNTAGMTLWVDDEDLLDAVTALSGSGPAYFFYLIEQMAAAGTALGLDESMARELAIETAYGAASMARAREHEPAVLRENVTSKGGTTAAALQVFDEQNLPAIVHKAMQAAHDRAAELGEQLAPE